MSNLDSERFSPLLLARILGIVGLAGIVTGALDIGYVQNTLIVAGNSAATVHNIVTHQTLFRLGFSAHLFEMVLNILDEVLFFILIRRVNGILAAIALCCGVIGIAVETVDLLAQFVPLQLIASRGALSSEQVNAFSHIAEQVQQAGLLLSWVFYGLDEFVSGILMFGSRFWPRALGILLAIAGVCYFINGFLNFLAPGMDTSLNPYIAYACFPGEFLASLWMATVGLNLAKWRAWTTEPGSEMALA